MLSSWVCLPNQAWGKSRKCCFPHGDSHPWKVLRKRVLKCLFGIPKSSFGRGRFIYMLPNEDFGRMNKRWNADVRWTFQWLLAKIEYSRTWKVHRTSAFHLLFILPKSSFGRVSFMLTTQRCGTANQPFRMRFRSTFQRLLAQIYARQTKILEGRTNISERVFEAHFNVL
jgi:hypothetical protein